MTPVHLRLEEMAADVGPGSKVCELCGSTTSRRFDLRRAWGNGRVSWALEIRECQDCGYLWPCGQQPLSEVVRPGEADVVDLPRRDPTE